MGPKGLLIPIGGNEAKKEEKQLSDEQDQKADSKRGNEISALGSGTVTIIEGDRIKETNYNKIHVKDPVYFNNLNVHILSKGTGYVLADKEFITESIKLVAG